MGWLREDVECEHPRTPCPDCGKLFTATHIRSKAGHDECEQIKEHRCIQCKIVCANCYAETKTVGDCEYCEECCPKVCDHTHDCFQPPRPWWWRRVLAKFSPHRVWAQVYLVGCVLAWFWVSVWLLKIVRYVFNFVEAG